MRKFYLIILCFISITALVSCGTMGYLNPNFKSLARSHKTIAVIPVHTILTGRIPEKMTSVQKTEQELAESLAFQKSLYNNLLNNSGAGKKDIHITIQPIEKTLKILRDSGIDLNMVYTIDPQALGRLLRVDAVVMSSVKKTRYLSDLESYGISLGEDVIQIIKSIPQIADLPISDPTNGTQLSKTYDLDAESQLFNVADGNLLWKEIIQTGTDWNYPANQVIEGINRRFARKFPYRKK